MSNLETRPLQVTYEDLRIPHQDCNDSSADLAKRGAEDHCHVVVTLSDGKESHLLRFDRQLSRFKLSLKPDLGDGGFYNDATSADWFVQHSESVPQVLNVISILGAALSSAGVRQSDTGDGRTAVERREAHALQARVPLMIANFIVTGQVLIPGNPKPQPTEELTKILLDVFANSDAASVQDFIGKIGYFKADDKLSEEARSRAAYVDSILMRVPTYNKFLGKLIPDDILSNLDLEDGTTKKQLGALQSFAAQVIIDLGTGKYFKYDQATYDAYEAYKALVGAKNHKKDFCMALQHADDAITGRQSRLGDHFVEECRSGIKLANLSTKDAAKASILHYLGSSKGHQAIKGTIPREVRKSKMDPDWLDNRGQIRNVTTLLLDHTQVQITYEKPVREKEGPLPPGSPEPMNKIKGVKILVDGKALKTAIHLLIQSEKVRKHREPIIAALGVLRLIFGRDATNKTVNVLVNGEYQEVPLAYDRDVILETIRMVEHELKVSFRGTEVAWPIIQATVGGLGVAGLGLGLGLKNSPRGVRQGLFTGGCAAAGFTLGSLVNLSKSKRVKNKHVWGSVGGAIGATLLGTACGLVSTQTSLFETHGGMTVPEDTRNPVDEYGP